jgi:hypothetical protein
VIIALTGLAGSGKDTAAEIIADIIGGAAIVALADLPKEMAAKHFDIPIQYFYDRELKDTPLSSSGQSPREMLVRWWDELFEEHGSDYSLQMNIEKLNDITEDNVIITDIRYPIEFDWIEQEYITLLNIQRNNVTKTIDHVTESGTLKGYAVDNNGTIEDLRDTLTDMLIRFRSKPQLLTEG